MRLKKKTDDEKRKSFELHIFHGEGKEAVFYRRRGDVKERKDHFYLSWTKSGKKEEEKDSLLIIKKNGKIR